MSRHAKHFCIVNGREVTAIFVFCKQTAADVNRLGRFLILDLQMNSIRLSIKKFVFHLILTKLCEIVVPMSSLIFVNKQLIRLFNYLKKGISDFDP